VDIGANLLLFETSFCSLHKQLQSLKKTSIWFTQAVDTEASVFCGVGLDRVVAEHNGSMVSCTTHICWTAHRKTIHEDIFQSPLSAHGFINSFIQELNSTANPATTVV
jgi:hypothetical protein